MSFYGPSETWKVVYVPREMNGGRRGVALVEAPDRQTAIYNFRQEYSGEFATVETCERLLG